MDTFYTQSICDRCGNQLVARIMSWFNGETICLAYSSKESQIKEKLKEQ